METINVVSSGALADNTVTMTGSSTKEAADVTTVNVTGRGVNLTIGGESVATVEASGVSGLGSAFTLDASASEADMTVTGSAVVPTDADTLPADTITTGDDGTTTNQGDDTIMAGDGDNVIHASTGDDTITMGSGDDTVTAGAGDDSIYMSDYDDDDVVDGGADDDTLSVGAIVASTTTAPLILQAVATHIDATPGPSRTSTPQFTDVEDVYMEVAVADANDGGATTSETVDFSSSTGIENLYLEVTDAEGDGNAAADEGNDDAKLTLNEVDVTAIHFGEREEVADINAFDTLGELLIVGAGQDLTVKGYGVEGATGITVGDVDSATFTAYNSTSTVTVGATTYGALEADDAATVSLSVAGSSAALGGVVLTAASLSAAEAESIALSAGSNNTLTVVGDVTSSSDNLASLSVTASDDAALNVANITGTGGDDLTASITLGINAALIATSIVLAGADGASFITVGANGDFESVTLFIDGGTTTIDGTSSSEVDIDTYGAAAPEGTIILKGRGEWTGTDGSIYTLVGDTTLNFAGWTNDTAGETRDIDGTDDDYTIVANDDVLDIDLGNGNNTVTTGDAATNAVTVGTGNNDITGDGVDTITASTGDHSIDGGAGNDEIDSGGGADEITTGAESDDILIDAATESAVSVAANTTRTFIKVTDFTTTEDEFDVVVVADALASGKAPGVTVTALTTGATSLNDTTIADFAELKVDIYAVVLVPSAGGLADAATGLQVYTIDLTGYTGDLGTGLYVLIKNNDAVYTADDVLIELSGDVDAPVVADFII